MLLSRALVWLDLLFGAKHLIVAAIQFDSRHRVGPRQSGKELTRPRVCICTNGGARACRHLFVALFSVRVQLLSPKHLILAAKQLFLAAKHAVACMSLPRGRFPAGTVVSALSTTPQALGSAEPIRCFPRGYKAVCSGRAATHPGSYAAKCLVLAAMQP